MTASPSPPGQLPIHALAVKISEAREARSLAAAALVSGDTNIATLLAYRRWLAVSRLLGDVADADAEQSLARAEAIFAANASRALIILPPHLQPE